MMNKVILKSVLVACGLMGTAVFAQGVQDACATRVEKIQTQIDAAKEANNTKKQQRLEKTLAKVKQNCPVDTQTKLQKKVDAKEAKLAKRQAELDEAKEKAKTATDKKIAKKQEKVLEAKQELEAVKQEINSLK